MPRLPYSSVTSTGFLCLGFLRSFLGAMISDGFTLPTRSRAMERTCLPRSILTISGLLVPELGFFVVLRGFTGSRYP